MLPMDRIQGDQIGQFFTTWAIASLSSFFNMYVQKWLNFLLLYPVRVVEH
jgi:hypothetical protein